MRKTREQKATYETGEQQEIVDDASPHKYFSMIPNMVDDSDLDPYERTLYLHYVRVGECWESVRTTAEKCKMSHPTVIEKRNALAEKGWITLSENKYGTIEVTIVDRWAENVNAYSKPSDRAGSHVERSGSHTTNTGSHVEPKKNPVQKPNKKNIYIASPVENSSPPKKSLQDDAFGDLIKDVSDRVTYLSPRMAEQLGELWDEYPDIDAHIAAMAQTDKFADSFNVGYYETCLSSWWAKHKKGKVTYGNSITASESETGGRGQGRPESADGRAGQRADAGVSQPTARASGAALLPRVSGGHRTGARSDPAP